MTKTTQQIPNAAKKKQPMTENTQKNNPEKWFTKYGTKNQDFDTVFKGSVS